MISYDVFYGVIHFSRFFQTFFHGNSQLQPPPFPGPSPGPVSCGSAIHRHRHHGAAAGGHGALREEPRVQRVGALQGARQAAALGMHLEGRAGGPVG